VIAYFILGLALLVGLAVLARWFVGADPKRVAKAARWILIVLAILGVFVLIFAGRYALAALLPLLIPFLLRSRVLWRRAKAAAGPRPGQTSEVTTRYLRMVLDHDSGQMAGEVLEGTFAGRRLDDLDETELVALWRECRASDRQSAAVLETYLDRALGEAWRAAAGAGPAGGEGAGPGSSGEAMSKEEAYEILGLEPGASSEEIREAHRRLMQKVHPDHGGSNYLAAKINRAKELLLGE
jgi:DnaJ-domain-containing protein 1